MSIDMERYISNIIWDTLRQSNVARSGKMWQGNILHLQMDFPPYEQTPCSLRGFPPWMQPIEATTTMGASAAGSSSGALRWEIPDSTLTEAATVLAPEQFKVQREDFWCGYSNATNHPFLMACTIHSWCLGGWFILAIPTWAIFRLSQGLRTSGSIGNVCCPSTRRPINGPTLESSRCWKSESRTAKVTNSWNVGILKKYSILGI